MENQIILSFGCWPQEINSRNFRTSPTTLRVIKNVKVDIDTLLPLSYAQFVLENNLMNLSKSQTQEQYIREMERRKKKIQILQSIWCKVKQKRSKSAKQSLTAKSSCLVVKKNNFNKRATSKSFHKQSPRNKSKSPLIFKAKSPKKDSTYSDYYNTNNHMKVYKKKSYQQQSTQSRRQKTNGSKNNDEYFNNSEWSKKSGNKQPIQQKDNLLNTMSQMLVKWTDLDAKHMQQIQQFTGLSERQKKRLLKIHQIQKQKLRKQIETIKVNIICHKKLIKGIMP